MALCVLRSQEKALEDGKLRRVDGHEAGWAGLGWQGWMGFEFCLLMEIELRIDGHVRSRRTDRGQKRKLLLELLHMEQSFIESLRKLCLKR